MSIEFYKYYKTEDYIMRIENILNLNEKLDAQDVLDKYVVKRDGKWALISKHTGKVLKYADGEEKPSIEWVDDQLKRIHSWESGKYS
jgi:hypothetical protein